MPHSRDTVLKWAEYVMKMVIKDKWLTYARPSFVLVLDPSPSMLLTLFVYTTVCNIEWCRFEWMTSRHQVEVRFASAKQWGPLKTLDWGAEDDYLQRKSIGAGALFFFVEPGEEGEKIRDVLSHLVQKVVTSWPVRKVKLRG